MGLSTASSQNGNVPFVEEMGNRGKRVVSAKTGAWDRVC
jgi:hypothetical protein